MNPQPKNAADEIVGLVRSIIANNEAERRRTLVNQVQDLAKLACGQIRIRRGCFTNTPAWHHHNSQLDAFRRAAWLIARPLRQERRTP